MASRSINDDRTGETFQVSESVVEQGSRFRINLAIPAAQPQKLFMSSPHKSAELFCPHR